MCVYLSDNHGQSTPVHFDASLSGMEVTFLIAPCVMHCCELCCSHDFEVFSLFPLPCSKARSGMEVRKGHGDIQADLAANPCRMMSDSAIKAQGKEEEDEMLVIMAFVFASGH